ncbi:MAG TPA: GxxExxY protein [Isosphaeraceae bacterium]|nr:GxxExxY protein [Isosphaeraceae bacterium]
MEGLLYAEESYAIRGAIFEVYREMGSGFLEPVYQECLEDETRTAGQLRPLPQCGGRTKDSTNLDCFRAFPSVPWLKNWFPMDMQTAFDTVVCLFAFPQDLDKHLCRGRSQENHSTEQTGMSQSLPLGV